MKNDPLIRMLLIVILGTIAFGLLFNIFTGGENNMGDMYSSNMLGNGSSINVFLASLLVLLVKFLLIVLVIALVIGVVLWIKNNFFKDVKINLSQSNNQDPMLKKMIGIAVIVVGFILVLCVLNNVINPGMGYSSSGMGNMYGYNMMAGTSANGLNATLGFTAVLSLLIRVLSYVFIISLIMGLVAYLKKLYEAGAFNFMKATINPLNTPETTNPVDATQVNNESEIK